MVKLLPGVVIPVVVEWTLIMGGPVDIFIILNLVI